MAAHCSSLMRRTSIPIPHAVTSPAPPLHPLQPLQTTCHGAAKSAMTSCSRRGSSLHQSGHPHHICIRQALRQGTSGTAANGKQGTCGLVSRFSTTFSVGHGACLFRRTRLMPNPSTSTPLQRSGRHHLKSSDPVHMAFDEVIRIGIPTWYRRDSLKDRSTLCTNQEMCATSACSSCSRATSILLSNITIMFCQTSGSTPRPRQPCPQPRAARTADRGSQLSSQRFFWACFCFSAHVFLCTATSECMAAARSACPIAS